MLTPTTIPRDKKREMPSVKSTCDIGGCVDASLTALTEMSVRLQTGNKRSAPRYPSSLWVLTSALSRTHVLTSSEKLIQILVTRSRRCFLMGTVDLEASHHTARTIRFLLNFKRVQVTVEKMSIIARRGSTKTPNVPSEEGEAASKNIEPFVQATLLNEANCRIAALEAEVYKLSEELIARTTQGTEERAARQGIEETAQLLRAGDTVVGTGEATQHFQPATHEADVQHMRDTIRQLRAANAAWESKIFAASAQMGSLTQDAKAVESSLRRDLEIATTRLADKERILSTLVHKNEELRTVLSAARQAKISAEEQVKVLTNNGAERDRSTTAARMLELEVRLIDNVD